MNTRKLFELCDSITDCLHSTPTWTSAGKLVIRNRNVKSGRLDLSVPSYTDDRNFALRCKRAKPSPGDIIITREAPMGEVCMIPENIECCLGQRMALLKPNGAICDSKYLLYALMSDAVQSQISQRDGTGTTVSNLRIPYIGSLEIPYVSLEGQRRIARTLSLLDEKIELNRNISRCLEQMTRTVYRSRFVAFEPWGGVMPDGWHNMPLGEFISFQEGPGIRNWQYVPENGIKFINIRCIKNGDLQLDSANMISVEEADSRYRRFMLNEWDIVISASGTLGRHAIVRKEHLPLCLNTGVIRFSPRLDFEHFSYVFSYLSSSEFFGHLQTKAGGSVQKNFGPMHLRQIEALVPTEEELKKYHRIIFPIIRQIIQKRSESAHLTDIRNFLLTRLFSV